MDRETARQEVLTRIKCTDFLERSKGGMYCCPFCGSGHGDNGTGAVKYYPETNTICCFGRCGMKKYDVIDLYREQNGTDYNTALSLMAADLGLIIDPYRPGAAADFAKDTPKNTQKGPQNAFVNTGDKTPVNDAKSPQEAPETDYTEYYKQCARNLSDPAAVSYLQARGISITTATVFGIGYDPAADPANAPGAMGDEYKPHPCPRIIIPTGKAHYVARSIDPETPRGYRKMNPSREKGADAPGIFNKEVFYEPGVQEVFVVEGAFDALSIIECGAAAVALNSTSNAKKLIEQLEQEPTQSTLILCQDNDAAGKGATEVLKQGLNKLKINYIIADINGKYNDPNDALTGDKVEFENAIRGAMERVRRGETDNQTPGLLPGQLTYTDAVRIFETADDRHLELKSFPKFSETAKIKVHDSVVIAADTGAGKSSLALNFLNDLNGDYPCIYINLEMDTITVLRRLTAIYSGIELDRIEGYKNDEKTAAAVNISLQAITSRKPLQVIRGAYMLQQIEGIIKQSTEGRDEPTIVIIDHSLLVDTQEHTGGRYERFTLVSEGLRRMALSYNIILFILLQQSRAGKTTDDERPKNSSLKESGSWENDATQICFLWYDPTDRKKKLLLTKNRSGSCGEFPLNYWKKTQTYTEGTGGAADTPGDTIPRKLTRREQQEQKLKIAYETAYFKTFGKPTIQAIAQAADVTTSTIKTWMKEYGGFMVNGKPVDPAGIDAVVEQQEFVKLTPADTTPFDDPAPATAGNGREITAKF